MNASTLGPAAEVDRDPRAASEEPAAEVEGVAGAHLYPPPNGPATCRAILRRPNPVHDAKVS
jgi:hypothetical protein